MKDYFKSKYITLHSIKLRMLASISGLIGTFFNFFRTNPIIIKFRHNLIIGSLGLIIIKVLFSTTFLERISLFLGIAFLSFLSEGKQKMQLLLSILLQKSFGYEYCASSVGYAFQQKRDFLEFYLRNQPKGFSRYIMSICFEISYFIRGLMFQFYSYIVYFRFIFDLHPYRSTIIYYIIIMNIIYYDVGGIILYIGGFLTLSKLLVYRVEHSLQEIKQAIYNLGLNSEILEKELTLSRKNRVIILYWSLRDIGLLRSKQLLANKNSTLSYILLMIQSSALYDIALVNVDDKFCLNFEFKSSTLSFMQYFGIYYIITCVIPPFQIPAKKCANTVHEILSACPGHKLQIVIEEKMQNGTPYYQNTIASHTSTKNGHMRPGAIPAYPHRDSDEYATCFAPIFMKNTETFDGIITYIQTMFIVENIKKAPDGKSTLEKKDFFDISAIENTTSIEENQIISDLISAQYNSIRDIKSEITITPAEIANAITQKQNSVIVATLFSEAACQQSKAIAVLQHDIEGSSSKAHFSNILLHKMQNESIQTKALAKDWSRLMRVNSNDTIKGSAFINNIKTPPDDLD